MKRKLAFLLILTFLTTALFTSCGTSKNTTVKSLDSTAAQAMMSRTQAKMDRASNDMAYTTADEFNTEEYKYIKENGYQDALNSPLSTFSIDVDTASYSNTRRFLMSGQLPPEDAVRIEEMINYFEYDYPQPESDDPFSVNVELSECPWNEEHTLAMIGLQGKRIPLENIPPSNLVFLLDVSGSMNQPDKLPLLKSAFKLLTGQLRDEDKISVVVYAGAAGVVLDSASGSEKEDILKALDSLEAGGSTAGGQGIELAYNIAEKNFIKNGNNRVILATDGDFNIGVSSEGELVRIIEKKREKGIFLSVLGFGTGNYKDSKMESLADKGNGNYAYIDNIMEARKVLVSQMGGTLFTIAKDVKIQIEFNPAKVKEYRLIGYENRLLDKEDFNDDKKDAGELGSGHTVTALYELIPAGSDEKAIDIDELKYQDSMLKESEEWMSVKLRYKQPDSNESKLLTKAVGVGSFSDRPSENFNFAAAVAEFGMLLRNSEFKGNASYKHVLKRAKSAKGKDDSGYRAEFIQMIDLAESLSK